MLFLDRARDTHWVQEGLVRGGLSHAHMTVGERLPMRMSASPPMSRGACLSAAALMW